MRRKIGMVLILTSAAFLIWGCQTGPVRTEEKKNTSAELPELDPYVVSGKLENGLTYYIRENHYPEKRIDLRLAVNAGSYLETEEQRGLAHFLEHMAFNGSAHYPGNALIDYLESIGMKFGADINAYTSFDETVFMLELPSDDPEALGKGLLVIKDWACDLSLDSLEIEKEKGVVLDEMRLRRNVGARLLDAHWPMINYGMRYSERMPIGLKEIIENADREIVGSFYKTWYQPSNVAVIIVGDVSADSMVNVLTNLFADKPGKPVPEKFREDLPELKNTLVSITSDPELGYHDLTMYFRREPFKMRTTDDYRYRLSRSIALSILNERLSIISRQENSPFLYGGSSYGPMVDAVDFFKLRVVAKPENPEEGMATVYCEARRAAEFGFLDTEVGRAVERMLNAYDKAYAEKDKTSNGSYIEEYTSHFLDGEKAPGIEYEYGLAKDILPELTGSEIASVFRNLFTEDNRIIVYSYPEGVDNAPDSTGLLQLFAAVDGEKLTAPEKEDALPPLPEFPSEPASVSDETYNEELELHILTLANGVKVYLHPTDYKNDEISIGAYSPGGWSLASDEDLDEAQMAVDLMKESGLADMDRTQFDRFMAGRTLRISPQIGRQWEGFSGYSDTKELETALQLVYMYFTAERYSEDAWPPIREYLETMVKQSAIDPDANFKDSIRAVLNGNNPRRAPLTVERINALDPAVGAEYFRDRFSDASDFYFFFSGNFDPDTLKLLARRYLGNLPATGRIDEAVDEGVGIPQGSGKKNYYLGLENKSSTQVVFYGTFDWSRENYYNYKSVADVLQIILRERIREELGGTYSISISDRLEDFPNPYYEYYIGFSSDKDRTEDLTREIYRVIDSLKISGVDQEYVDKVNESFIRGRETSLRKNSFWTGRLQGSIMNDFPLEDLVRYRELAEQFNAEVCGQIIKDSFSRERSFEFHMYPSADKAD